MVAYVLLSLHGVSCSPKVCAKVLNYSVPLIMLVDGQYCPYIAEMCMVMWTFALFPYCMAHLKPTRQGIILTCTSLARLQWTSLVRSKLYLRVFSWVRLPGPGVGVWIQCTATTDPTPPGPDPSLILPSPIQACVLHILRLPFYHTVPHPVPPKQTHLIPLVQWWDLAWASWRRPLCQPSQLRSQDKHAWQYVCDTHGACAGINTGLYWVACQFKAEAKVELRTSYPTAEFLSHCCTRFRPNLVD